MYRDVWAAIEQLFIYTGMGFFAFLMIGMITYMTMSSSDSCGDREDSIVVFDVFVSLVLVVMIGASVWVGSKAFPLCTVCNI